MFVLIEASHEVLDDSTEVLPFATHEKARAEMIRRAYAVAEDAGYEGLERDEYIDRIGDDGASIADVCAWQIREVFDPSADASHETKPVRKINGIPVDERKFAFDNCHKIYLLKSEDEANDASEYGYAIHPIEELPECWTDTCPLRFVQRWSTYEDIVCQFEPARFEGWDIDDELAKELDEMADEQNEANESGDF